MIQSFRHKGLRLLFERGQKKGVPPELVARLRIVLADLDAATDVHELSLPGYRLHPLKGELKGFGSITVSGNWRVIFQIAAGNVYDVDLIDYH
jgi:proteic killer suppression protein